MEEQPAQFLVQYCKAADYNAATGECVAPFYGPASSFPPALDVVEGIQVSAVIIGAWAIGFYIKQARRTANV